jgi:hypothetical protein
LVGLVVATMAMALAALASAKTIHYVAGAIGAGELSLEERSGIAYDKENDKLYVADTGHGRIARYAATGGEPQGNLATLTEPTFLALDYASGGDFYVVEGKETIVKLDPSGTPISSWGTGGHMGGFGEIGGIAVDPSGNLFILGTDFAVHELSPGGSVTSECSEPYRIGNFNGNPVEIQVNPVGTAADGEGHLFISLMQPDLGGVTPFVAEITTACGKVDERFGSGYEGLRSPSVDEADNSLFIARDETGGRISHYSAAGTSLTPEGTPSGIASFGFQQGVVETGQLTVRSSDEAVFVNDLGHGDVAVYVLGNVEPPQIEILPPTEATTSSARLRAKINPGAPAGNPPAWTVRYRIGCVNLSREEEHPHDACSGTGLQGTVPAGSEPVLVEGMAEGIEAASEYAVFVQWENAAYLNESFPRVSEWDTGPRFQTGAIAPTIAESFVTEASESTGTVVAKINPHGAETGYVVEYVTQAQFEASGFAGAAKTPEQTIPAGIKGVPVSFTLTGLANSSSYVARFFATSTIEGSVEEVLGEPAGFMTREPPLPPVTGCANEIFRTGFGALLPDCRAYEQVTPTDKNGGGPEAVPGVLQATEEPAGITFYSQGGIPGGVGAQDYPSFFSTRGEGSWSTQGLLPPATLGRRGDYLGLTPGGRYSISEASRYDPAIERYRAGLFERDLRTGETMTVVPYNSDCPNVTCYNLAGASADGSRVFIETKSPLTKGQAGEETTAGQPHLFFWERGSGQLSLVDVNEAGEPLPEGAFAGPLAGVFRDTHAGGSSAHFYVQALNAVTSDGGQIVYSEVGPSDAEEEEGGEGEGHRQLYVRVGLGSGSPRSIEISAYQEGREGPAYPAEFLEATPDGRYVFFRSKAELTSDSYSGEGTASLYRYDVATEALVDVTSEKKTKFQAGPGIVGMIGASESGQLVYLVSTTVLSTEPGPGGSLAQAGKPNLYLWREGAKKPYTFIATLRGVSLDAEFTDARDWSQLTESNGGYYNKTARVSADGGAVVFATRQPLTGEENRSKGCGNGNGIGPCSEFFRYSATTGSLDCLSCDPTGVQPVGSASIGTLFIEALDLPLDYGAQFLPKNLSADGDRFFFQTPDPLLAADVNGNSGCQYQEFEAKASCMDVYEWEAPGSGSCPQAAASTPNGGCLYLISTGQSEQGSYFADADREGRNAYLLTYSRLVPADRDTISDIYDAAEGGGLGSQHQEPAVPCGSRQACQGPQLSPQAATSPGSSSFVSPGNPKAVAPCKKGQVRRHGRCVKKPKHHKKRHRKHHKRKAQKGGSK